jgi:hypothetical protein
MPARRPSAEILAAVRDHFRRKHPVEEPAEEQIVYAGSGAASAALTTWEPATAAGSAWFSCSLCPGYASRYRLDLYAPEPSERDFERIGAHFAHAHPGVPVEREEIWTEANPCAEPKAVFLPRTERAGAGIVCKRCLDGMATIRLEEPPYGDARRNLDYLRRHPELYQELRSLSRSEQAARVEAKDRGIVTPVEQRALARALAEARQQQRPRTITPLERALQGALLSLIRSGLNRSDAITELLRLQAEDPVHYRCLLGEALPELAAQKAQTPRQFAALVAKRLGATERKRSTLWKIRRAIPDEELGEAEAEGEAARQAAAGERDPS